HCNDRIDVFGTGKAVKEVSQKFGLPLLAEIPYDKGIVKAADEGKIDECDKKYIASAVDILESGLPVSH
ncbi:MAG: Mrp/NBP35 family ATP-binding protein, partial [Clostridiales bacterium]|nr:Mrp/NBP35 family ATP-binding protein [Clostridiales bacterium]